MTQRWLLGTAVVAGVLVVGAPALGKSSTQPLDVVRSLYVYHDGRLLPLERFARHTLADIAGSPEIGGTDPVETVLSIPAMPNYWTAQPLIALPSPAVGRWLGFEPGVTRVSLQQLEAVPAIHVLSPHLLEKLRTHQRLTELERGLLTLAERMRALEALLEQELYLVPPSDTRQERWLPILRPDDYTARQQVAIKQAWSDVLAAVRNGDQEPLNLAARRLATILRNLRPELYDSSDGMIEGLRRWNAMPIAGRQLRLMGLVTVACALFALWNKLSRPKLPRLS